MASPTTPSWSQPDSLDNMTAMGEQEFANFLDLDLDLNFSGYGPDQQGPDAHLKRPEQLLHNPSDHDAQQQQQQQHHHHHHHHEQRQRQQQQHAAIAASQSDAISHGAAMFDFDMPMAFDQTQEIQFSVSHGSNPMHAQSMIPPTPNSVEMHGDTVRYLQHLEAQNRALIEQQYRMRRANSGNFTPLVSPAVAAYDARYNVSPDYAAPGTYFSPLTSPALEGQMYPYHTNTSASSIAASSPVEPDVDMGDAGLQTTSTARRTRKRPNTPRSDGTTPKPRNSPTTKPQSRRKTALSSVVPLKDPKGPANRKTPDLNMLSTSSAEHQAQYASSTESISPEPLSEAVMGPPQKPASAMQSPAILARTKSQSGASLGQGPSPATPASLMRLPQTRNSPRDSPQQRPQGLDSSFESAKLQEGMLEDLVLPESAATGVDETDSSREGTPRFSARKTPKLGPLSTPSGSGPASATMQPRMTPTMSTLNSPSSASFTSAARKADLKSRTNKKRGSISNSTLVSPALRPKISPNIKPMMPKGATLTDDAHTIFLASRSNYQNLIDGTHVPGVSYPTELSTNLTSKRTSHKIAEQGRRNRINVALQEMLSLLPKSSPRISARDGSSSNGDGEAGGDSGSKKGDLNGKNSGNSKAATVESAIDYIRSLQQETEEKSKAVEAMDRECILLKRKLEEMERLLGEKGLTPSSDEKGESTSPSTE